MDGLKLKVGKTYVNKVGLVIKILDLIDGYYYSDETIPYFEDGSILIMGKRTTDHSLCIIEEC